MTTRASIFMVLVGIFAFSRTTFSHPEPPDKEESPFALAIRAFSEGDYEKTIRELKRIPRREEPPEQRLLAGRALLELRRYTQADRALHTLERELPSLSDLIFFLQADAKHGLKHHRLAAEYYRRSAAVSASRWSDKATERAALEFLAAKKYAAAIREIDTLLDQYPDHPDRATLEGVAIQSLYRSKKRAAAIERFRWLWLTSPTSTATRQLESLMFSSKSVKNAILKSIAPRDYVERVARLRKAQAIDETLKEAQRLAKQFPEIQDALYWEAANAATRDRNFDDALALLARIGKQTKPQITPPAIWMVHKLRADLLARQGRLDEGIQELTRAANLKSSTKDRNALLESAAKLLAEHARYAEALAKFEALAKSLPTKKQAAYREPLAWLAYRSGNYKLAMERFDAIAKENATLTAYTTYWNARTLEKQNRHRDALDLYRILVEHHADNYYGQLARTRLTEHKETVPTSATPSCAPETTTNPSERALEPLAQLVTRVGKALPELGRAQILLKLGMRKEAQRELNLVAYKVAKIVFGSQRSAIQIRRETLRMWFGAEPPKQLVSDAARKLIAQQKQHLVAALGDIFAATELSFWAWQFKQAELPSAERDFPRLYDESLLTVSERYQLNPQLLWAIMRTESTYRPDAISPVGAVGLMQIMPLTAERLANELNLTAFDREALFDPKTNIQLAGYYLHALNRKFQGQIPLVAAAYNGGPQNVSRWLDYRGKQTALDEFVEEIPYIESKRYAKKVVLMTALYEQAHCNTTTLHVPNTLITSYAPHPNY